MPHRYISIRKMPQWTNSVAYNILLSCSPVREIKLTRTSTEYLVSRSHGIFLAQTERPSGRNVIKTTHVNLMCSTLTENFVVA